LRNNPPAAETHARADGLPAGTEYASQQHIHDKSQPENLIFLARLRSLVDTYPHRTLLAEIGDDDALERMAEYTAGGQRFHMAYSFHLLEEDFDLPALVPLVAKIDRRLTDGWPCWSLSNHDVPRVITRWFPDATSERRDRLSIVLLAFLLSLRGSVCLYQGDELGLDESDVPFEQLQDAFGIAHWPRFKGRDGCRTPMPWTAREPLCGFSTAAQAWLPMGRTHVEKNAETQSKMTTSVLSTTQRLLAWRAQSAALKLGSFDISTLEGRGLCIRRSYQDEHIVVLLNFSTDELRINAPSLQGAEVIAGLTAISGQWEGTMLKLPPSSATYLKHVRAEVGGVQLNNGDKQ
jgi:alpha-glucosidase